MLQRQDIRQRVTNKAPSEVTTLYYLIKELKCLPDILGREFEVIYDDKNRIKKIKQIPIKINTLQVLLNEMNKDYEKQERQMAKIKKPRRK